MPKQAPASTMATRGTSAPKKYQPITKEPSSTSAVPAQHAASGRPARPSAFGLRTAKATHQEMPHAANATAKASLNRSACVALCVAQSMPENLMVTQRTPSNAPTPNSEP